MRYWTTPYARNSRICINSVYIRFVNPILGAQVSERLIVIDKDFWIEIEKKTKIKKN